MKGQPGFATDSILTPADSTKPVFCVRNSDSVLLTVSWTLRYNLAKDMVSFKEYSKHLLKIKNYVMKRNIGLSNL